MQEQETTQNNNRRLACKRPTTIKKTDQEHPINKRMKTGGETESCKENIMDFSNWVQENISNISIRSSGKKIPKKENKVICKDASFKVTMQDLNKLEERTLKLRRCETEKFKVNEISFDTLNEQPLNSGEIYEELMRLRAENNGFKNQIKQKEKDTDEK